MGKYKRVDTYNKLVRDRIPEIIESDGLIAETRILGHEETIIELKKKIVEESNEFVEAETVDEICVELADLREAEIALMKKMKSSLAVYLFMSVVFFIGVFSLEFRWAFLSC